ncbi:PTS fructose transporter subunit IIC [Anaerobranca gottschalkii]|uniref:PTS system D-fructose-specific IIB component (F1P-forming), Frc family /PTS system D-fructose-specific IIC component (F1P-forming), Frc family n=1 Tax=Anaerobranca gottschalkii DSM 13577 TaxID=1120990 RepID=A0A1H9ZWR6_9FIRM|nr:fructose-specific PTS transporter subunit EIIC [Anaerobranca gottschalkii]SES86151.1 PTS system D-fructose-specific IIB component (F1P-forming), Frc family /PTS system D-fructose-specific IIC component (F1P-forming), Frc family [Anaerobranca gottschalkii DSM 13577]
MKKLVAVTSCPTGIAHTYMAAESLEKAAKELGYTIKVETQGSAGAENVLTEEEIEQAHAVIIAAATNVAKDRFEGKTIIEVGISEAIKNPQEVIKKAVESEKKDFVKTVKEVKEKRPKTGFYKHLMTGVSNMIPLVVAGGIIIAISFAFGYDAFQEGGLPGALMDIGGGGAFALMIPILAGFIAYSIADRPGLAPGLVGGLLAAKVGAGFLGGIIAGFLAGYIVEFLKKLFSGLPKWADGLKPVLIYPLLSVLAVGLLMIYVIGKPISYVMDSLTLWLEGLQGANAAILGLVLGLMMAFDMGGPVNKVAYAFGVGLIEAGVTAPMAAIMAAGMTPPLGLALATVLFKDKFNQEEREAGKAAWVLGISFITEGAIPFAAADPLRVIPSIMAGSAVAGALSMIFGCTLRAPHGGIFVVPFIEKPFMYLIALAIGSVVTAFLVSSLKALKK